MAPTRPKKPPPKPKPEPDVGLKLDQELNDTDIFVVSINGKDRVGTKETIEKLKGVGIVKMSFANRDGRDVKYYT